VAKTKTSNDACAMVSKCYTPVNRSKPNVETIVVQEPGGGVFVLKYRYVFEVLIVQIQPSLPSCLGETPLPLCHSLWWRRRQNYLVPKEKNQKITKRRREDRRQTRRRWMIQQRVSPLLPGDVLRQAPQPRRAAPPPPTTGP